MRRTTFSILCLEGATLSFNVAAASALIPSVSKEFGVTQLIGGKLVWLYMLPYGIAALFYGPLVRVFNAKKVELIFFFLFCLANLLAGLSRTIGVFFAARFLMGIFGASVIPLMLILIANYAMPKNRGRLVGIFFSSTFVASLLGVSLSGILPWRWIFIIPAIFGFILWIHMYIYLEDFKTDKQDLPVNYPAVFTDKKVFLIFTYIFFISLFYHGVQQWLSVYFSNRYNYNQFIVSMLITSASLSGVFGEALGGWFSDSLGRVKTINIGILLMILGIFTLMFHLPFAGLVLLMLVWGFGWTLNHAGLSTLLTDLPKQYLNESASLNSSVRFVSGGIGVVLGGALIGKGFNLSFIVFGCGLLTLLLSANKLLNPEGHP